MKKSLLILLITFLFLQIGICQETNQNDDKTVTLIVTGNGKTRDEARQKALRSAIEQAFGVFVSSKTEILNDKLVKDEIVSVSNGNIQKYDVLNEMTLTDTSYVTTLKTIVSVNKLISFCESKGVNAEFKGALFAINMQMRELQEKNEKIAWNETIDLIDKIISKSFNCDINIKDPKFENDNTYSIPINIIVSLNDNIGLINKYIKEFCVGVSVQDIDSYRQINKKLFYLNVFSSKFYFRNKEVRDEIFNLPYLLISKIIEKMRIENGLGKFSILNMGRETRMRIYNDYSYYTFNTPNRYIASNKEWYSKLFGYWGSEIAIYYVKYKRSFCFGSSICGNELELINYLKTSNVLLESHNNQGHVAAQIEEYDCNFERLTGKFAEFNLNQNLSLDEIKKITEYKIDLNK